MKICGKTREELVNDPNVIGTPWESSWGLNTIVVTRVSQDLAQSEPRCDYCDTKTSDLVQINICSEDENYNKICTEVSSDKFCCRCFRLLAADLSLTVVTSPVNASELVKDTLQKLKTYYLWSDAYEEIWCIKNDPVTNKPTVYREKCDMPVDMTDQYTLERIVETFNLMPQVFEYIRTLEDTLDVLTGQKH